MGTAYLDIHVDLARCPSGIPLRLQYDKAQPVYDFSGPVPIVPPGTASSRILLPVYRTFQALDLGAAPAACVSKIERLDFVRRLPILPVLTLPPDWRGMPFHQSLQAVRF
jgi:hypothetical protein